MVAVLDAGKAWSHLGLLQSWGIGELDPADGRLDRILRRSLSRQHVYQQAAGIFQGVHLIGHAFLECEGHPDLVLLHPVLHRLDAGAVEIGPGQARGRNISEVKGQFPAIVAELCLIPGQLREVKDHPVMLAAAVEADAGKPGTGCQGQTFKNNHQSQKQHRNTTCSFHLHTS